MKLLSPSKLTTPKFGLSESLTFWYGPHFVYSVSFLVNPLLTYQFVSKLLPNKARTSNSLATYPHFKYAYIHPHFQQGVPNIHGGRFWSTINRMGTLSLFFYMLWWVCSPGVSPILCLPALLIFELRVVVCDSMEITGITSVHQSPLVFICHSSFLTPEPFLHSRAYWLIGTLQNSFVHKLVSEWHE